MELFVLLLKFVKGYSSDRPFYLQNLFATAPTWAALYQLGQSTAKYKARQKTENGKFSACGCFSPSPFCVR